MFSINQCKLMAKQQLKDKIGPLMNASLIMVAINSTLSLTQNLLVQTMPLLTSTFMVIQFCISSILSFAFIYLTMKLVKTRTVSFADYQTGITKIKPALLGNLWHTLWLTLWKMIFIVPIIILFCIPYFTSFYSAIGFDWNNPDPSKLNLENINLDTLVPEITNDIFEFFKTNSIASALLFLFVTGLFIITIIKGIQYSQMFMVLSESALENKKVSVKKALNLSKELTKKQGWHILGFHMSFIGWILLICTPVYILCALKIKAGINDSLFSILSSVIISFGTGFILPYIQTATVNLYGFLKQDAVNSGRINLEEFD